MRHLLVLLARTVLITALAAVGLAPGTAGAVGDISDTVNVRLPAGNNAPAAVALRFSQATFPDGGADRVLLATTEAFADALASGGLQGVEAPLLLTPPDVLRSDVAAEIERLGAESVTVLGGTAAISTDVEERLVEDGLDVDRLGGPTRFETAIAVSAQVPQSSTAIVARGFAAGGDDTQAFADALAAGAWAAEEGWPTYLTQSEVLTDVTEAAIAGRGVDRVVLLGGEAAIAPEVEDELEALGVTVDRVSGATRFDTAVAIAEARGFAGAGDAERIILVEGQAADAWAGGFAASAHGALVPAPVVLANGEDLPPATVEFLLGGGSGDFAVDAADVTDPVLICAASAAACDQARLLLGLPQEAELVLDEPDGGVPSRSDLTGTIDLFGSPASVAVFGQCVEDGLVVPDEDGAIAIAVEGRPGVCQLAIEVTFGNGSVQRISRSVLVAPAEPVSGVIVDTETGGDAYTFAPDGGDAVVEVAYGPEDLFVVDGEPATIGAFEASVTVADLITFSADTADGTLHELANVDPMTISSGTVGDVDLSQGTMAIIEPLSGVALRPGIDLDGYATFTVGGAASDRAGFEADVNEGDRVVLGTTSAALANRDVTGTATDIAVDAVSGVARFRIGALGDDPLNAEDARFRAVEAAGAEGTQTYRVGGSAVDFQAFAAALTEGDRVTYRRTAGVESFTLTNAALPPVEGLVTETADPDGSPVAPEPSDGGDVVVLTPAGRRAVAYGPDAVFRIDGRVATEGELEAALTAGDEVAYQAGDAGTGTSEAIELVNRDLSGDLADITLGEQTIDVIVLAGVVYDDLPYTEGILGGAPVYRIDGDLAGLAQFEQALQQIAVGELVATIVVRATPEGTELRLTTA